MSVAYIRKKDGGIYEICWTEKGPDGEPRSRRKSTRTKDRERAEAILVHFITLKARLDKDAPGSLTVGIILDDYEEEHVNQNLSSKGTAKYCLVKLRHHFGALRPQEIGPDHVLKYNQLRRAGVLGRRSGDGTIRRELGVLVAAINHAAKYKRISKDDVPYIPLPVKPDPKDRWLTKDEARKLLAASGKAHGRTKRVTRLYRFIFLALHTASRRTALQELKWSQVDMEHRRIDLNPPGRKRTKKRRPIVPISDQLYAELEVWRGQRMKNSDYVLDHPGCIRQQFVRLAKKLDMDDVTPHTMRHTWGTWAAIDGKEMWKIAGVMGISLQTALSTYLHHSPHHLRDTVDMTI